MIKIGDYHAEGPFTDENMLENRSGIYVILTKNGGTTWNVVDVGESHAVRDRVSGHDREDCWRRHSLGMLGCAVIYTPGMQQAGRKTIEQELRRTYSPLCGDR